MSEDLDYEAKAEKLCSACHPIKAYYAIPCTCAAIAQALRLSASEAWGEAEALTPSAWAWLKEKFREKQYALRGGKHG